MIENKRFQSESGDEMNGHWIFKKLTTTEKAICYRIVQNGSVVGWNQKSLNGAHIKRDDINHLVSEGLVRRVSLIDLSKETINNEEHLERFKDLEDTYGLPCFIPRSDQNFFYAFITVKEAVENPTDPQNSEIRFQVNEPLYSYLDLIL
jgi:hypothetical protein